MPKLNELLVPLQECNLFHPIVGKVKYKDGKWQGWGLFFGEGVDEGKFLDADDSVLFDEDWQLLDNKESIDRNKFNNKTKLNIYKLLEYLSIDDYHEIKDRINDLINSPCRVTIQ